MNVLTANQYNHSIHTGQRPEAQGRSFASAHRKSPVLSPAELRRIIVDLLG